MPKLPANDVPHTSQTDHRVMSKPLFDISGQPNKELKLFQKELNKIPEQELLRAEAIALVKTAELSGKHSLVVDAVAILEEWVRVVPEDITAHQFLGTAYYLLEEHRIALGVWETALKKDPDNEYLLRRVMMVYHENELLENGIEAGRKLIAINPNDYEYFGRLSHMLGQNGETQEAIKMGERALELDPSISRIHRWLGELYDQVGNPEKSQFHLQQAKKLGAR